MPTSLQCQPIIKALRDLQSQAGKVKRTCEVHDIPVEVLDAVKRLVDNGIQQLNNEHIKMSLTKETNTDVCRLN